MPKEKKQNRSTLRIRPIGDRTVTQQTVEWLRQSGASQELLDIAQQAAKRGARRAAS